MRGSGRLKLPGQMVVGITVASFLALWADAPAHAVEPAPLTDVELDGVTAGSGPQSVATASASATGNKAQADLSIVTLAVTLDRLLSMTGVAGRASAAASASAGVPATAASSLTLTVHME